MRITVQLSDEGAQPVHARSVATPESQMARAIAEEMGIALTPLHPDTDDSVLRTYFTADVPDAAAAQRVIEQLRRNPAVRAAYVKPPDALP